MSNLANLVINDGAATAPADWTFKPVFNDGNGTVRLEALVDGRPDLSKKLTLRLQKNVQPGNMTKVTILFQEPVTKLVDGEDLYDGFQQVKREYLFKPDSTIEGRTDALTFSNAAANMGSVLAYVKDLDAMI